MADKGSHIDQILDNGIDLKNRRIYFGALPEGLDAEGPSFSWRSVERAVRAMHIMESESPSKPIELHMSSPGGSPYDMKRLMDVIQCCSCQVKFFGSGQIMSAATWVMAVCDERYLYPSTRVLIHDSPAGDITELSSKLSDMYIAADEEKFTQNELNQVFADNSRMPKSFWDEMIKRDVYLSAEETVLLGLADKIVEYKKRGNLRKVRQAALNKTPSAKTLEKLVNGIFKKTYATNVSEFKIHVPEDKFDSAIVIDSTPVTEEEVDRILELPSSEPLK